MQDHEGTAGTSARGRLTRRDLIALTALALLTLVAHHRVVFDGVDVWAPETGAIYEPMRAAQMRLLRAGEPPTWDPRLGLGYPLLADSSSGVFYPLNLIVFSCLPFRTGALVLCVVRAFLAAAAAYALARALGIEALGATLAGAVFMLNGFVVANQAALRTWWSWIELPLLLLAAERLVTRPRIGTVLWASLVFGMALLAGHYQLQWVALVLYAVYGIVRTVRSDLSWRQRCGRLMVLGLPVAVGLMLTAVQVLPSAELLPLTRRSVGESAAVKGGMPPQHLVCYLFPSLFRPEDHYWRPFGTSLNESFVYVGVLPLVLAAVAWRARRRRAGVMALAVGAGALTLLSFGQWMPLSGPLARLPGFGWFGHPSRYVFGVGLCLGLLAGIGLETAVAAGRDEARRCRRRVFIWVAALTVLAPMAIAVQREWVSDAFRVLSLKPILRETAERLVPSLPALAVSLVLFWMLFRKWRFVPVAAVAVAAIDLVVAGFLFDRGDPEIPAPALRSTGNKLVRGPIRKRLPRPSDTHLRQAGAPHGGLAVQGHRTLWFPGPHASARSRWVQELNTRPYAEVAHLYRALHVGWIMAEEPIDDDRLRLVFEGRDREVALLHGRRFTPRRLYECRDVLPRAFLVERAVPCPDAETARQLVEDTSFDAAKAVVIESAGPNVTSAPATATDTPGNCRIELDEPREVRIRVQAGRPAWLVLTDLWYPGWTARVDGQPATVHPANYACRAVRVPAGDYDVVFTYRSTFFRTGLRISLGTLAALLLASGVLLTVRLRRGHLRRVPGRRASP